MVTEEALPTYMSMLNTLDGVRDETGASQTPWAVWTREWTAEENRHGDVMNRYMYLTGALLPQCGLRVRLCCQAASTLGLRCIPAVAHSCRMHVWVGG